MLEHVGRDQTIERSLGWRRAAQKFFGVRDYDSVEPHGRSPSVNRVKFNSKDDSTVPLLQGRT